MKRVSAVHAKAHFSELVADAERGTITIILKHGKTAAILGPESLLGGKKKKPKKRMTPEEFDELLARMWKHDNPNYSAVQDLIDGRR